MEYKLNYLDEAATDIEKILIEDLEEAVREIKAIKNGAKRGKTLESFLNEL